jgi:hypothetical protein
LNPKKHANHYSLARLGQSRLSRLGYPCGFYRRRRLDEFYALPFYGVLRAGLLFTNEVRFNLAPRHRTGPVFLWNCCTASDQHFDHGFVYGSIDDIARCYDLLSQTISFHGQGVVYARFLRYEN